jgi:hypothetical protein
MASNDLLPNTHAVVEPKAKYKYKIKKEKDTTMEELVIAPRPWLVGILVMKMPIV